MLSCLCRASPLLILGSWGYTKHMVSQNGRTVHTRTDYDCAGVMAAAVSNGCTIRHFVHSHISNMSSLTPIREKTLPWSLWHSAPLAKLNGTVHKRSLLRTAPVCWGFSGAVSTVTWHGAVQCSVFACFNSSLEVSRSWVWRCVVPV